MPIIKHLLDYHGFQNLFYIQLTEKITYYYKYKMKRTEQAKMKYTLYKNTLTKVLRIEKRKYYSTQLTLYKNDIKTLGRSLNRL